MEGNQYWLIERQAYNAIVKEAREKAWEEHPKQRRRRFDAENDAFIAALKEQGDLYQSDWILDFTNPVGIVYRHKVNLGTKKWADYRTDYAAAFGRIEKETEASVLISESWYRKDKIVGIIAEWDELECDEAMIREALDDEKHS